MINKSINLTLAIIIVIMQICGIMVLCGVLRLARFSVIGDKIEYKGFIGFPIPGIALLLTALYLTGLFNIWIAYILMIIVATLMVSNFKYPKVDNYPIIAIAVILIILTPLKLALFNINIPALILFIIVLIYLIIFLYYNLSNTIE